MRDADASLFLCKHCKGLFNIQAEATKHQQTCLGNPFKSSCHLFACERKIFLQLFQSEDFQSDDGYFSTQNISKDDSFLNHIVKVRLPQDIIDPSIFLRTPVSTTGSQMADDSAFLLEPSLNERGDSNFLLARNIPEQPGEISTNSASCTSYLLGSDVSTGDSRMDSNNTFLLASNIDTLESDVKKSNEYMDSAKTNFTESMEEEQIRKIINKNIDYLKSSEIANLSPSMSKSGTFPTSHSESRLLSPIDKHFLPYGSKSRVQSPFDKSLNFLDGGVSLNTNQCMYASNSSLPFSCNLSTDLLSSLASSQDDNQQSLLNNIEECPTLQYLDLAKKDPFFGQNLGLSQVNMKDPFLISDTDKSEKLPAQPSKEPPSQLTKGPEDFQASPSFALQDSNYFNFPSILDEPTQLDYLDLATLDFLTNPNGAGWMKEDGTSSADPCDNLTESVEDADCSSGKSAKRGKTNKMKSLALKKVKCQIEKKKKTQAQREKETLSALSQGLNLEVMPRPPKIKVNSSSRKRKITPTQDSLDRSDGLEEKTKPKFDRKFNEKQRICQTGQILNIKDQLTGFTDEEKDSMKAVFGQNGCIIVKKQKLTTHRSSCFDNVGFMNERPVLRRANSLDERSDRPREVPDQDQQAGFRYLEGDAPGPFGIAVRPPCTQRNLTSVLKLKCQECSFKCTTVAELKEHYDQHENDKRELEAECESVLTDANTLCDSEGVFTLDLNTEKNSTDAVCTAAQMVNSNSSDIDVLNDFENDVRESRNTDSTKVPNDFSFEDLVGNLSQSYESSMTNGIDATYVVDSNPSVHNVSTVCETVNNNTNISSDSATVTTVTTLVSNTLPDLLEETIGCKDPCVPYSADSSMATFEPRGKTTEVVDSLKMSSDVRCVWKHEPEGYNYTLNQLAEGSDNVHTSESQLREKFDGFNETGTGTQSHPSVRTSQESAFVKYTKVSSETVTFSDNSSLQPLESVQVLQPDPYIVVEKELCQKKGHSAKKETKVDITVPDKAIAKGQNGQTTSDPEDIPLDLSVNSGSNTTDKKVTRQSKRDIHVKCKESLKSYLHRKSKENGNEKHATGSTSKTSKATKRTQTPGEAFDDLLEWDDVESSDDTMKVITRSVSRQRTRSTTGQYSSTTQKGKSKRSSSHEPSSRLTEDSAKGRKGAAKSEMLTCELCNYTSKYPNYLKEHMRKHEGNYLYCSVPDCDFKTFYMRNLNFHLRKHGSTRDLLCDQCAYTFNDQNSLKRHIQHQHLKERRFKCPDCEFVTLFRGDVLKHYRNMHRQQKLYACNQCEYRTGYTHLLKFHLMAHAGIRPYKCSACDYQVNNGNKVTRHIRTRHAGEVGIYCEKLDLTFEVDAKQFQCETKMCDDDVQVIELTNEQIQEYAIKKREEKKANEIMKGQEKSKKGKVERKPQKNYLQDQPRMVSLLGDLTKIAQSLKDTTANDENGKLDVSMRDSRTFVENYLNNNSDCSVLVDHSVDIDAPLDNMRPGVIELVKIPVQSDNIETYDTAYQCVGCTYMFSSYTEMTDHLSLCNKQNDC